MATADGADGRTVPSLAFEHPDGVLTDLHHRPGQGVLRLGDVRRIAGELRRGGWAVRDLPRLRSIEVHPDRLSGRPVISGTRVPAELVAHLARTAAGRQTLRADYGVTPHQMKDAVAWWQAVEAFAAAA